MSSPNSPKAPNQVSAVSPPQTPPTPPPAQEKPIEKVSLGLKPAEPKKEREAVTLPSEKKAKDMLDFMLTDGTPPHIIEKFDAWMSVNPDGSASVLYHEMNEMEQNTVINIGTLRKAGKWIWGESFEPDQYLKQLPGDELVRAREELAQVKTQLRAANSDKAILKSEVDFIKRQKEDMLRELTFLRAQVKHRQYETANA
jgi:hypothetical protein